MVWFLMDLLNINLGKFIIVLIIDNIDVRQVSLDCLKDTSGFKVVGSLGDAITLLNADSQESCLIQNNKLMNLT